MNRHETNTASDDHIASEKGPHLKRVLPANLGLWRRRADVKFTDELFQRLKHAHLDESRGENPHHCDFPAWICSLSVNLYIKHLT
jgi:hypothetical protein